MTIFRLLSTTFVFAFIFAVALRTFLVMGLIEPVLIASSSMAPTFLGPHCSAVCSNCKQTVCVAAELVPGDGVVRCGHCLTGDIEFIGRPVLRGDSLVVDRTVFHWREPRRWEPVVFRNLHEAGRLCIKRVVGLPGETIELRGGQLLVDGQVVVKSLAEQRTMRQRVHREGHGPLRWHEDGPRLGYRHPNGQPITDNMIYNASLSRRLNSMHDLMLSVRVANLDDSQLAVEIDGTMLSVRLDGKQGTVEIWSRQRRVKSVELSSRRGKRWGENFLLEVSTFDRQLLVAIDGGAVLCYALSGNVPREPTPQPFAIRRAKPQITLSELTVWRDIYLTNAPVGIAPSGLSARQKLGVDEFFVLGDNPSISVDSRSWGPLPGRLLVGKPFGGR